MTPMFRGFVRAPLLALTLAVSLLWGVPASAHPTPELSTELAVATSSAPTLAWSSAPAPPTIPWPLMLTVAAVLIVAGRRPRRALALAIVLILAVFAFENGLHSVHHLNDPRHPDDLRSGAQCSVAAASAQLAGTPADGATQADVVLTSFERVALQQPLSFCLSCLAVHQGRAPPLPA
jgi:hypothetical protein